MPSPSRARCQSLGAGAGDRFPTLLSYSPYRETESDRLGSFGYYAELQYEKEWEDMTPRGLV